MASGASNSNGDPAPDARRRRASRVVVTGVLRSYVVHSRVEEHEYDTSFEARAAPLGRLFSWQHWSNCNLHPHTSVLTLHIIQVSLYGSGDS